MKEVNFNIYSGAYAGAGLPQRLENENGHEKVMEHERFFLSVMEFYQFC